MSAILAMSTRSWASQRKLNVATAQHKVLTLEREQVRVFHCERHRKEGKVTCVFTGSKDNL